MKVKRNDNNKAVMGCNCVWWGR